MIFIKIIIDWKLLKNKHFSLVKGVCSHLGILRDLKDSTNTALREHTNFNCFVTLITKTNLNTLLQSTLIWEWNLSLGLKKKPKSY